MQRRPKSSEWLLRNSGAGAREKRFGLPWAECSLGSILVAATAKGVCAVLLGDDPEALGA